MRTQRPGRHPFRFAGDLSGPLMDMDMLRVHDSGRALLCEWKRGHAQNGNIIIDEGMPPIAAFKKLLTTMSVWLVIYDDPGTQDRAPNVLGLRKLIGPEAGNQPSPCTTEQFRERLQEWATKNGDPAYLAATFAAQALALANRAIEERAKLDQRDPACDAYLDQLLELLL